jgi:hypothetical protein
MIGEWTKKKTKPKTKDKNKKQTTKKTALFAVHSYKDTLSVNVIFTFWTGTSSIDSSPLSGTAVYMMRAVKLEVTPSGSFYNPSQVFFYIPQNNRKDNIKRKKEKNERKEKRGHTSKCIRRTNLLNRVLLLR